MNVILIGAGRGNRLMPLTSSEPKCFDIIAGKRILDWTLNAFKENCLDRFGFIAGYLQDVVRKEYPHLTFVENGGGRDNNILFSLLYAREHLAEGFYATYMDTLYRSDAVRTFKESTRDITLVMDTRWRER